MTAAMVDISPVQRKMIWQSRSLTREGAVARVIGSVRGAQRRTYHALYCKGLIEYPFESNLTALGMAVFRKLHTHPHLIGETRRLMIIESEEN